MQVTDEMVERAKSSLYGCNGSPLTKVNIRAALTAALSAEQTQPVAVKALSGPCDFAGSYEFRGDGGDYTPTESERAMIEDAICGYLSEIQSARRSFAKATTDLTSGHVFTDTDPEAQWIKDSEEACPHCGGSGHKDDVRSALVDVPAEPVAIGYVSSAELQLLKQSATVVDLFSKPELGPMEFIPVYTSPPLSREGEDTAGMVREELRAMMLEQKTSGSRETYTDGFAQGLCFAIERLDALAATRSGSARASKGGAE